MDRRHAEPPGFRLARGNGLAVSEFQPRQVHVAMVVVLVGRALLRGRSDADVEHTLGVHRPAVDVLQLLHARSRRENVNRAQPSVTDPRTGGHTGGDFDVSVAVHVAGVLETGTQGFVLRPNPVAPIQRLGLASFNAILEHQIARLLRFLEVVPPDLRCGGQVDHVLLALLSLETVDDRQSVQPDAAARDGRFGLARPGTELVGLGPLVAKAPRAKREAAFRRGVGDRESRRSQRANHALFKAQIGRSVDSRHQLARLRLAARVLHLELVEIEIAQVRAGNGHHGDLVEQAFVLPSAPDARHAVLDQSQPKALQLARANLAIAIVETEREVERRIADPKFSTHTVEVHVADRAERTPLVGPAVASRRAFPRSWSRTWRCGARRAA